MAIIALFVCFALTAMVGSMSFMQFVLVCAALMITACFIVKVIDLREKLLEKITDHSRLKIDTEFKKDTIKLPTFDKNRKHIKHNMPNQVNKVGNNPFLIAFLVFTLKILQSRIMLSLASVELLEAMPSFCADLTLIEAFHPRRVTNAEIWPPIVCQCEKFSTYVYT